MERTVDFVYRAPVRTKVAIVGGGPAGMLLSHLLWRADIDNVVVEQRSREYVEATGSRRRDRAGHQRPAAIARPGCADGSRRVSCTKGSRSPTRALRSGSTSRRLVDRVVMVYGQTEIQKDLYDSATCGLADRVRGRGRALHGLTDGSAVASATPSTVNRRRSRPTTSPAATASTASAGTRSRRT